MDTDKIWLQQSKNGSVSTEQIPLMNYGTENRISKIESECSGRDDSESDDVEIKSYKRRWWLLLVYFTTGFVKGQVFNTWPPITDSVTIAFGWTTGEIAQIPAADELICVVLVLPMMYIIQSRGLRTGMVLAILGLSGGCALMLIDVHTTRSVWLQYPAYCLVGISSSFLFSAAPLFSVTWFPPTEWTTTTAFSSMSVCFGLGMGFLTGPYLSSVQVTAVEVQNRNNLTADYIEAVTMGIYKVVYLDAVLAAICLISIIAYFPSKPPKPPSIVQTKEREDFWEGLRHLMRNSQFWLVNLTSNLSSGPILSWVALAFINFGPLGVGQVDAGWIGSVSIVSASIGSVIFSRIADYHKRRTKLIAKVATGLSATILSILACIQQGYIVLSSAYLLVSLFILSALSSICIIGTIPIFYEMGCEVAFPVSEGLAGCVIALTQYLFAVFYRFILIIPALDTDTRWMTWSLVGCTVVTLALLFVMGDNYKRLDLEEQQRKENPNK